jgi:carbohydrate kinase (thermoresistant glucokinase family)
MATHAPVMARTLQLVVMGVSGCGKSTVAQGIASALGLRMVDGDDLHLPQSVAKMSAGIALDDSDRWPWLDRIGHYLAQEDDAPGGRVVACSALKRAYRDRIRSHIPNVLFMFLDGDAELIRQRMAQRVGHYMQPELLDSQLQTLERPGPDEADVMAFDITLSAAQLVTRAVQALQDMQAQR